MSRSIESVFSPDRYVYIPRVAIFCTHEAVKNGQRVKVTKKDLEEIRDTHNAMWEKVGKAAPFSYGHTRDRGRNGEEVSEAEQPNTYGAGVSLFLDKEPNDPHTDFLYCTWAFPKSKLSMLDQVVSLSPEYRPKRHLLWPIAALKSTAPELDLPPIPKPCGADRLCYSTSDESYRLILPCSLRRTKPVTDALINGLNRALSLGTRN
jgi:hypothetical protein